MSLVLVAIVYATVQVLDEVRASVQLWVEGYHFVTVGSLTWTARIRAIGRKMNHASLNRHWRMSDE